MPTNDEMLEAAIAILRERGAPLVCPADDCVHVAKAGVWATGNTLSEALDKLDAKIAERRGAHE